MLHDVKSDFPPIYFSILWVFCLGRCIVYTKLKISQKGICFTWEHFWLKYYWITHNRRTEMLSLSCHLQHIPKWSWCSKVLQRLFSWRWDRHLWTTTFQRILNRNGRSEMGQSFCIIFLSRYSLFNRGLTIAVFISCGTMPWEEMQFITSFSRNSKTQSQVGWAAWLCCSWTSQMKA